MTNLISIKKYPYKYPVTCKCPRCEQTHTVMFPSRQIIMPRIACDDCKPFFKKDDDGEDTRGLSVRCNTAQRHRRAANK